MVKFFHEAPNSIFNEVQKVTDGDYFLVHLFEENPTYLAHAKQAVADGREVILDNSIFELGTAFDADRYAYWIEELKPTWYIIPDVLEDSSGTKWNFVNFKAKYSHLPGKRIAVAQGSSLFDMLDCFDYLHNDSFVDMVAISFDLKFYEDISRQITINANPQYLKELNPKLVDWSVGRAVVMDILSSMYQNCIYTKPVHLLGCALPMEGVSYGENIQSIIYSTDTSNPVIAGYEEQYYIPPIGLYDKSKTKLFKIIDEEVSQDQLDVIISNIKSFKNIWEAGLNNGVWYG